MSYIVNLPLFRYLVLFHVLISNSKCHLCLGSVLYSGKVTLSSENIKQHKYEFIAVIRCFSGEAPCVVMMEDPTSPFSVKSFLKYLKNIFIHTF